MTLLTPGHQLREPLLEELRGDFSSPRARLERFLRAQLEVFDDHPLLWVFVSPEEAHTLSATCRALYAMTLHRDLIGSEAFPAVMAHVRGGLTSQLAPPAPSAGS